MKWRTALLSLLLFACSNAAWAISRIVTIPDGDVAALKASLVDAHSSRNDAYVIRLGGEFRIGPDDQLPNILGEVALIADRRPARFVAQNGGPVNLVEVVRGGIFRMTNVSFEGFDPSVTDSRPDAALLVNHGVMELMGAHFSNNLAELACDAGACDSFKPLILNTLTGYTRLSQVSVVDSGVIRADSFSAAVPGAFFNNLGTARVVVNQVYLTNNRIEPIYANRGELRFRNVTFKATRQRGDERKEWIRSSGSLRVSNSIIEGFAASWCDRVLSAGYNLVDNARCEISAAGDIVGEYAGLRWRPVSADWLRTDEQILTHALIPIAGSPAIDSANDEWCPDLSLQSYDSYGTRSRIADGDNDGVAQCDRGAIEIPRIVLASGGINGLYYNPQSDGHYVYVADTANNAMVMWTTFDQQGNQAWIFGIADELTAGRSMIARAYINRDGRVSLDGQFDPATSEHWGYLELEMTSCNEGTLAFRSDQPGFASGEFEIQRLAFLKQLDCEDSLVGN